MFKLKEIDYIPLKTLSRDYCCISCYDDRKIRYAIMMCAISEQQEEIIESAIVNKKSITIYKDDFKFVIEPRQIYCYGECDFSNDSEDLDVVVQLNWNAIQNNPVIVVGGYNYSNHSYHSFDNKKRYFDTIDPVLVIQYLHGMINKPERICIFKTQFKI